MQTISASSDVTDACRTVVTQAEIGRELRSSGYYIPWRFLAKMLKMHGVELLPDGPRRWLVRRADWDRVRAMLQPLAVAS